MAASRTGFERTTETDMTTDDERREVARRLRELDYSDLQESVICAYLDALGIKGYEDWVGIAHRLADLIEPSCDRDALLDIADECDMMRDDGLPIGSYEIDRIARRIREALGVEDG